MQILVSILPVILFLIILIVLDSFKLVKYSVLSLCLLWGIASAVISYFLNSFLIDNLEISYNSYSRYISPFVEETCKIALIILLIRKHKIGFMVDGAIYGFAVGAGFAILENLFFLHELDNPNIMIWIVRGVGTAIMHGGTVSVMTIIIMQAYDKKKRVTLSFIWGWLIAVMIHSVFNQFILPPLFNMLLILVSISLTEFLIFRFSEQSLRKWLQLEFDSELGMMKMINEGKFSHTRSGEYLHAIKSRFSMLVVVDMLAYISLYLELSIRAKSNMMLKEVGLPVKSDPEIKERLTELKALEKSIGKTGLLSISPILRISRKGLWEWSML